MRRLVCWLCVWVVCAVTAVSLAAEKPSEQPHVLFIAIDDQNDWIGCLGGHPQVQTPHIDKLAVRGTLFTNAHCQAPLCNPSRTSLLTGKRPETTGIYGLAPSFRAVDSLKNLVSLPQHMRRNGYKNYTTGKIYHGPIGRGKMDDEFDVIGPGGGVGVKPAQKLVKTPSNNPLVDWGTFPHRDEDKGDWQITDWAIKQLEGPHSQPFFLSVGYFLPHVPCYVTQKWYDLYPSETLKLPPVQRQDRDDTPRFSWYLHWKLPEPRLKFLEESQQWANLVRSYLASTSFVDAQIGRLLEALERSGHAKNTVIVLWSDHGWHLGEKLITGKNTLWDRGTKVPLIFAGPGVSAGVKCNRPAELLDIYPTLIELCGLPAVVGLEGHSLGPQLRDATAPREWPAITTHNAGNHGIRTENWRYIRYADGSEELYDMRRDPHEWTNLAGHPKHIGNKEAMKKWLPAKSAAPAPGSQHRILTVDGSKVVWEGEEIGANDAIPEL